MGTSLPIFRGKVPNLDRALPLQGTQGLLREDTQLLSRHQVPSRATWLLEQEEGAWGHSRERSGPPASSGARLVISELEQGPRRWEGGRHTGRQILGTYREFAAFASFKR